MDANVLREWEQEYGSKLKFNAGIDYDIERVIFAVFYEFDENQEPRFSIFCQVWKESKFGLIFCGRDSFRDRFLTEISQGGRLKKLFRGHVHY